MVERWWVCCRGWRQGVSSLGLWLLWCGVLPRGVSGVWAPATRWVVSRPLQLLFYRCMWCLCCIDYGKSLAMDQLGRKANGHLSVVLHAFRRLSSCPVCERARAGALHAASCWHCIRGSGSFLQARLTPPGNAPAALLARSFLTLTPSLLPAYRRR